VFLDGVYRAKEEDGDELELRALGHRTTRDVAEVLERTAGNDAAVAKCIEQQLRTWSFPAPGEVKQVQIPFVFVRQ
jgi:hypothetical protein